MREGEYQIKVGSCTLLERNLFLIRWQASLMSLSLIAQALDVLPCFVVP